MSILLLKKLKINVFVYRLTLHQLGKNADMEDYGKKIKSIWNYIKINKVDPMSKAIQDF